MFQTFKKKLFYLYHFGPKDHRCSVWHSEKTVLTQANLQLFDFIDDQFSPDQLPDYIKLMLRTI